MSAAAPEATVVAVPLVEDRLRRLGALPSMKWMYTYGPPTARIATTTIPPMSHRCHPRVRAMQPSCSLGVSRRSSWAPLGGCQELPHSLLGVSAVSAAGAKE